MAQRFVNNFTSFLDGDLTFGGTTLTLNAGDAAALPLQVPVAGEFFLLTLFTADFTEMEVVKCTSVSGDVVTIDERGYEGTQQAWNNGTLVSANATARSFEDFANASIPFLTVPAASTVEDADLLVIGDVSDGGSMKTVALGVAKNVSPLVTSSPVVIGPSNPNFPSIYDLAAHLNEFPNLPASVGSELEINWEDTGGYVESTPTEDLYFTGWNFTARIHRVYAYQPWQNAGSFNHYITDCKLLIFEDIDWRHRPYIKNSEVHLIGDSEWGSSTFEWYMEGNAKFIMDPDNDSLYTYFRVGEVFINGDNNTIILNPGTGSPNNIDTTRIRIDGSNNVYIQDGRNMGTTFGGSWLTMTDNSVNNTLYFKNVTFSTSDINGIIKGGSRVILSDGCTMSGTYTQPWTIGSLTTPSYNVLYPDGGVFKHDEAFVTI